MNAIGWISPSPCEERIMAWRGKYSLFVYNESERDISLLFQYRILLHLVVKRTTQRHNVTKIKQESWQITIKREEQIEKPLQDQKCVHKLNTLNRMNRIPLEMLCLFSLP